MNSRYICIYLFAYHPDLQVIFLERRLVSISIYNNDNPLINARLVLQITFRWYGFRTTQQNVWLQANGAQFFHRVLSGLSFGFTRCGNVRH